MARKNPYRRKYNENIVDAIQLSGWNVIFLSSIYESPFRIRIYNGEQSRNLCIFGWGLTHGGGLRNPNEYRIQVQVTEFKLTSGFETLVLGWWPEVGVFAGFDVRKHLGILGNNDSIQVGRDALQRAVANGMSTYRRQNDEIVIAFRPEMFAAYATRIEELHGFARSSRDIQILEDFIEASSDDPSFTPNDEDIAAVTGSRRTVTQTVLRRVRDSSFQRRILTAYEGTCAFCNVQLKLIEAAHILPVESDDATDLTSNGVALCALHHKAYDASLLTFNAQYDLLYNASRVGKLTEIGHEGGLSQFLGALRPILKLPPSRADRPNVAFVRGANTFRGWDDVRSVRIH